MRAIHARPAGEAKYKACIIGRTGRGDYGHGLDTCFQKVERVTVAAVADPDEAGREAARKRSGAARSYADWREMLAKEKPNLVSIGTRWVEDRIEMVGTAAAAGAHVYMEKPLAQSLDDADRIIEAADAGKVKVALAFHALLAPSVLHLKKMVGEGLLGDLLEMRARGKEDRRAGGEDMMVLGTHCMYLLRLFGGEPLWCSARVTQDGRDVTRADAHEAGEPLGLIAGDSIQASFAFAGGLQGHFASQKVSKGPGGRFQISLHGSKGIAVVHIGMDPEVFWLDDPLWSPGKSRAAWKPVPGTPSNDDPSGLKGQDAANHRIVEDLIDAAEKGREPAASAREGRSVLEMILSVYASHLKGARAALPLADRKHPLR
jgi:predicted dehydrogenase